jgi:hypothetical protein
MADENGHQWWLETLLVDIVICPLNNNCSAISTAMDIGMWGRSDSTVSRVKRNSSVPIGGLLYFMCGRCRLEGKNTVLWQKKGSVSNKPIACRYTKSRGCQQTPPGAYCFPGYWITEQVEQGTGWTTPLQRVNDLCVMFSDPWDREETMAIRPVSLSPITIPVNQNENAVTEYIFLRSLTQ